MPYSGANDANLPKNVKVAHSKLRAQWVAVFNDTLRKSGGVDTPGAEAKAFKMANGVLKSAMEGSGTRAAHANLTDEMVENKPVPKDENDSNTASERNNPARPFHARSTNFPNSKPAVQRATSSHKEEREDGLMNDLLRLTLLAAEPDDDANDSEDTLDQDAQDAKASGTRGTVPDGSSDSAKNRQKKKPGAKPKMSDSGGNGSGSGGLAGGKVGLAEKMLEVAVKDMIEHTPEGSFEHIKQLASRELNPPYDPQNPFADRSHFHIIGTYPQHVIATSWQADGTGDALHKIPYKYSAGKGLELDKANAQRHKIVIAPAETAAAKKEIENSEIGVALKKVLDAAARKALPKSKFAYVDENGKGHFPINDEAHVRNALARLGQSPYGPKARAKVMAAARRMGIEVAGKKDFGVCDALGLTSPLQIFLAAKDADVVEGLLGLRSRGGLEQIGVDQVPEHDYDGDDDFADDTEVGVPGLDAGHATMDGSGREIKGMNPLGHHFVFEREPDGTLRGWLKELKTKGFLGKRNSLGYNAETGKLGRARQDAGARGSALVEAAVKAVDDPILALAVKEFQQTGYYTSGQPGSMVVCHVKGDDGVDGSSGMRFFAPYTNCYSDRHDEIMATAGHKWYAEWATKNNTFPEAWLWHTKGTRWGKIDSLDFIDGVMLASGVVDPGCEELALTLAAMGKDLGWSHGFVGLKDQEGVWTQYIDVEITALPRERAANALTGPLSLAAQGKSLDGGAVSIFQIANEQKEGDMPLPPAKVEFFKKAGLGEKVIETISGQHDEFVSSLKGLGLEWKDEGGTLNVPGTDLQISEKDAPALAPIISSMTGLERAITGLAGLVKTSVETSTKAMELATKANMDLETAVTKAMQPRAAASLKDGFRASEQGLTSEQIAALAKKDGVGQEHVGLKDDDTNWFFNHNQQYLGSLGLGGLNAANVGSDQVNAAAAVAKATAAITNAGAAA